jgi:hypothetical protein
MYVHRRRGKRAVLDVVLERVVAVREHAYRDGTSSDWLDWRVDEQPWAHAVITAQAARRHVRDEVAADVDPERMELPGELQSRRMLLEG